MKTKLLLWSTVLFFVLGVHSRDGFLFYFFSVHLFMLYIGVHVHKFTQKLQPDSGAEPLPDASE